MRCMRPGEETANEVPTRWIRELQANEKKMREKMQKTHEMLIKLEVSKEILEEIKEWNQEKTRKDDQPGRGGQRA